MTLTRSGVHRRSAVGAVLGKLAVLLAGVLVTLLIGEALLRAVGLGHPYYSAVELYQPSADPNVLFEPRPSFVGFSEGTPVTTNSRGLRERELPIAKPPGTVRVLFLGDSVTFGAGVRDDEAFPRLLEGQLAQSTGRHVETINAGVVGYNTTQELARLRQVGLAYQPDIVVLTFLVNDLLDTFSIFDHQYDPTGLLNVQKIWLRRNSHLFRFTQNTYWRVAQEVRRARTGAVENRRDRDRLLERLTAIDAIAQTSREHRARFLLVLYPDNLNDVVVPSPLGEATTVRDELLRFAAERGYGAHDLSDALGDVRDARARQYRLREDPHPSPLGHQMIARSLAEPLRTLVDQQPREPE